MTKGEIKDSKEKLLVKIPLTFESELENLYNVNDLFIGKVSLIGIYKGIIKNNGIKNLFEYFQELGQTSNTDSNDEVHNSQHLASTVVKLKSEDDGVDYSYINLLAIVQVIKSSEDAEDETKSKKERKKQTRRKKAAE